jgi:hypothetical protein
MSPATVRSSIICADDQSTSGASQVFRVRFEIIGKKQGSYLMVRSGPGFRQVLTSITVDVRTAFLPVRLPVSSQRLSPSHSHGI